MPSCLRNLGERTCRLIRAVPCAALFLAFLCYCDAPLWAQTAPPEPTMASICLPGAGEIGLQGVVQKLSADKSHLTLSVMLVRTSDGKKTPLSAPRVKEIDLAPGVSIFRATEAGKDEASATVAPATDAGAIETLTSGFAESAGDGATVVCLGANGGEGTRLLARSLVILHDATSDARARLTPGKNLLPPITDRDAWWVLPIGGKTKAESTVEDDALKVVVSVVDDQDWHVLLTQSKNATLVSGATYKLSFLARADAKHPYLAQSQIGNGDYHNTGLLQNFTPTTEWQPFVMFFTAHDTVAGFDSCPTFPLGKETGTVYFKDMKLEATGTAVTPGNLLHPIADPESWSIYLMNRAEASLARENDGLRITVAKGGKQDGDVQVRQYGAHLDEGKWYTVRFRAHAPVARKIRVSSGTTKPPYQEIGLNRTVTIGPDEKTYVLTFQVKSPQNWPDGLNVIPAFLIGDAPGTLWLSGITLAPGRAAEQP